MGLSNKFSQSFFAGKKKAFPLTIKGKAFAM